MKIFKGESSPCGKVVFDGFVLSERIIANREEITVFQFGGIGGKNRDRFFCPKLTGPITIKTFLNINI
ncbi:MAG: hypothetical protein KDI11_08230 [Alphaproteobacteria bacterium]|nr:hypothetical protein [Alphaproteobacteria bacterium]